MTESDIQYALYLQFGSASKLMAPNVYIGFFEADMARVAGKGLMLYEYEIKLSRSDFKADFKTKTLKHARMKQRQPRGPNYFYFVCPNGLIQPEELPRQYGLIWVTEVESRYLGEHGFRSKCQKRAGRLHDRPCPQYFIDCMTRKLMHKTFNRGR